MPGINDYLQGFRNGWFASRKKLSGITFIDIEVGWHDKKIHDFGAFKRSGRAHV